MAAPVPVLQAYRYARPSDLTDDGLLFSTSGGAGEHPHFVDGVMTRPAQFAAALLVVTRVARTRFWTPPNMVAAQIRAADPVVTADGEHLRFESFSVCCGVHVRLDVLGEGFDGEVLATGTTNVDVNPPLRRALARVTGGRPLHLRVGEDLTVTTLDGAVTEEKVPLPDRWLKGFAEVQLVGSTARRTLEVGAAQARAFVRTLPASGPARGLWSRPAPEPACGCPPAAGPGRSRPAAPNGCACSSRCCGSRPG